MSLIAKAKRMALIWHGGQYRRDGKTPYWKHPMAVAGKLKKQGAHEYFVAIAWLHDILEDTNYTQAELVQDFPCTVADAVITLTKRGQTYEDYLKGVRANPFACRVKIADMLHNLSDSPTEVQILKYAKGLAFLMESAPSAETKEGDAAVKLEAIRVFLRRYSWDSGQDVRDEINDILRTGHHPLCDYVSDNPEGILKPCNCGQQRAAHPEQRRGMGRG